MKAQFLFLTFLFTIISCKNDSKESTPEVDPIIGTWKIEKALIKHSNGTINEQTLNDCTKKIRHTYNPDGTLTFKQVKKDLKTNECIERAPDFWTGKWNKLKKGNYKTVHVHKYPHGQISGYSDSTDVYTFSNNDNTLVRLKDFKKVGILLDSTSTAVSEVITFTRTQ